MMELAAPTPAERKVLAGQAARAGAPDHLRKVVGFVVVAALI